MSCADTGRAIFGVVCYSEAERKEEAKKRLEKRLEKRENLLWYHSPSVGGPHECLQSDSVPSSCRQTASKGFRRCVTANRKGGRRLRKDYFRSSIGRTCGLSSIYLAAGHGAMGYY